MRNPADPRSKGNGPSPPTLAEPAAVTEILDRAPLPRGWRRKLPHDFAARCLAAAGHLALVAGLIAVGWKHFDRPITGLAMATCYLLLPYTRVAEVDGGQLVPSALIVGAIFTYTRPVVAGLLLGWAAGWMPAAVGLIPLWAGFYRGRGTGRFLGVAVAMVAACVAIGWNVPGLSAWGRALGAHSLSGSGIWPGSETLSSGGIWTGIDPAYRIPVLIVYFALVGAISFFPDEKNLAELIAASAALMVASQFWYLDEGGALILIYLPLVLLMVFRPNLSGRRPPVPSAPERLRLRVLTSAR